MHAAENSWEEAIAGHGEPHSSLADLEDQQRRDHAHECANQYHQAQAGDVEFLEGIDHGSGVVKECVPANQSGEDDDDSDIEDGANDERGDDATREIALGILALFGSGGDGIKTN